MSNEPDSRGSAEVATEIEPHAFIRPAVPIPASPVDAGVRAELHRITTEVVGDGRLAEQADAVLAVAARNGLAIQLVESAEPGNVLNCFRYALQLRELPKAVIIMCEICGTAVKSDFIRRLIANRLTHREDAHVREGDVVVYFDQERITHAGVIRSGLVESKWGTGQAWRHRLFEVPSVYGERVQFFEPLSPDLVLEEFIAHLESECGDPEEEADELDAVMAEPVAGEGTGG